MKEHSKVLARPVFLYIREVFERKKWNMVWLLIAQIFLGISGVGYAVLIREVVDEAVEGDKEELFLSIVFFACLVVIQLTLSAVVRFLEEYARASYENIAKSRLFETLLTKEYQSVTAVHSGEWMNRLTSDTTVVADGLATIVPGMAGMAMRLLAALGMIFYMEPTCAYILIPAGLCLIGVTYVFRKILKQRHKQMQEKDGKVRTYLQEHLGSLLVVRAFGAEQLSLAEAQECMEEHKRARMKKNHFSNLCNVGFGAIMHGAYVFGLAYGSYGILNGTMTYGTLMAMLQLISQIQHPLANITGYLPKYYAMVASAERLLEAEQYVSDIMCEKKELGATDICMRDVYFSYEEKNPVLCGFSMDVPKGTFAVFTGASGNGKSTIVKLLLGLYCPASGEISPCNREMYAYVPQGNYLMSDTIRNVVSFAKPKERQDETRLREALTVACAEFVYELPQGLDTRLGERGLGLSEGQMQRIAIARAIFADRPILILDEATSALDEATEKEVLERLRRMTDKTVLLITHRPAALEICDQNIVLSRVKV